MSSSTAGQISTPSSDFKSILDAGLSLALSEYKNKTGKPLLDNPLAAELQRCDSVDAIKAVFQGQAEAFQQFRDGDERLTKWINPVVDVLSTFSDTIEGVAGIGFPPAGAIFGAIGVLLTAAKDVRASHDALVELLEPMKEFFERLGVYTQIPLTAEMAKVLVKIVAEIFSILSIATKEVKRKRAKIYFRKLLGRTDIEDALNKLNSLIQKDVPVAIAQTMMDVNEIKWNHIEQDVRRWFSPPDPSTNHNTACGVYHNAPPMWFFEAGVFKGWMSKGSLLWVHGKPGSGKSVLCAAIIQHIMTLRDAGSATLTYFYFDFRDEEKQNVRNAVTSLLVQLSAYSKHCCDIIHRLYSAHGKGTQQPSIGILIDRLKEMLTVTARQKPIFIVMDALDESPDYGTPIPREEVLNLVMVLVRLQLPNLHICVTSRPEIDIQTMLKPLAVNAISLHDETKQKFVIANYVSSVVSSDARLRTWRDEDKKLVVEELSERADGMFQWVFCQLDMLRHTVEPDVRAILSQLPKTLDETYERVLKDINENNRERACRLFHCLAVAVRPLRVEELAEILTLDFDAAEGGIPKFHPDRRPKDQEEAVLSICSSLVTVVDNRGSRVVQFSHFSVKEFLTSNHLASSTEQLTPYHILPGPAHTMLARVCLGLLLHSDDSDDNERVKDSPLAEYAARNWIAHAQFEDVASRVEDGMVCLFDPNGPHFAAWISLYDIDTDSGGKLPSELPSPLYYAALCGFHALVQHIAIKHPHDVNATGGSFGFPLVAALYRNHFPIAEFLLEHGGMVDARDERQQTALYKAIDRPGKVALDAVRFLLDHGADVNARRDDLWTSLHLAVNIGELSVAWMLLEHQADVNLRNDAGQVPLHLLFTWETSQKDDGSDIAKLLLEHGANVNERDKNGATPLHLASHNQRLKVVRVLLDHDANADAKDDQGKTPLQLAYLTGSQDTQDGAGVALLLLEHGAKVYARDKYQISTSDLARCIWQEKIGQTLVDNEGRIKPKNNQDQNAFRQWIEDCGVGGTVQDKYDTILLHSASYHGGQKMVRKLLQHGVKSNAMNHRGETALHVVSRGRYGSKDSVRVARLLLEHGLDVNGEDKDHDSPLHSASYSGKLEIARVLLHHGANPNLKNDLGETPLHQVSQGEYESQADGVGIAKLLLNHGVDVNSQTENGVTSLHLASWCGKLEIARLLLEHTTSKNNRVRTLLHVGAGVQERIMDSNVQQKDRETPLHFACFRGKPEIARFLLDHGAQVNLKNYQGETPLHLVSRGEYDSPDDGVRVAELLLERGTDANAQDKFEWTPLHSASYKGRHEIVQVLLSHGARANLENYLGETPLHLVRQGKYGPQGGVRVAQLLLDGGFDVNARDKRNWTPLHAASYYGRLKIAQVLLDRGAITMAVDGQGKTALHQVSQGNFESLEAGCRIAELLLERGVDPNAQDNNLDTPLHVASRLGRPEIVQALLGHTTVKGAQRPTSLLGLEKGFGVNINALSKNNWTPLHLACSWGKLETARLLLDNGANAILKTDSGETALHVVVNGIHESLEEGVRVAQLPLERGADVNAQSKRQYTPLYYASSNGKLEIVRLLLDHGAEVDTTDDEGLTPLYCVSQGNYASEEASVGVARLLLERGADVNAQSKEQRTPLCRASYYGKLEISRLLLDHGAKVDTVDERGLTPLYFVSCGDYASEEAGVGVARLLLERGADVNAQSKGQRTPLHRASYNGKLEIARLLLDHGAEVDTVDDQGFTPLHCVSRGDYASEEAGVGVARLLLGHGADVNAQSKSQYTPLRVASYNAKLEIARLLLDRGAEVNTVDDKGLTPLHCVSRGDASEEACVGVARLLLERGADVNAQCKKQRTPLRVASYDGKLEIARLLLDHGAEVGTVDDEGFTPLHCVSRGNYASKEAGVGVAWLLLKRGADVNAQYKASGQRTPLHVASYRGMLEIVRLLLDRGANVDAVDHQGCTPLHDVSRGKYDSEDVGVGITRLLLEHGADANAKTRSGKKTPLDLASYYQRHKVAQLLAEHRANASEQPRASSSRIRVRFSMRT